MKRPSKNDQSPVIVMWHGGRRWDGPPEIQGGKKGATERGPGIYCTTNYLTARKYASGGGQVRKVTFSPASLLDRVAVPLEEAILFTKQNLMRRTHDDIIERLRDCADRHNMTHLRLSGQGPHVPANALVNLCINSDQAHGAKGLALNRFLVSHGIDAVLDYAMGSEVWGVIFNPACILDHKAVPAAEVSLDEYDLPNPIKQLETAARELEQPLAVAEPDFSPAP